MKDYPIMVKRYGEERAKRMQAVYQEKFRLRNYQRMAFINTTAESNLDEYKDRARQRAAKLNLRYEEIPGSVAFMEKIAGGDWDGEFMIAPPGRAITFEDFFIPDK